MAFVPNGSPPDSGDFLGAALNFKRSGMAGKTEKTAAATRVNPAALRAQRQYQQSQIETASPTRLIVLLYDGAIRFASLGMEAMQAQNYEEQNTYLLKTQRIVTELTTSLDRERGGDVAANLRRIYTFLTEQLVRANMQDDAALLQAALKTLTELRESWIELDRTQGRGTTGGAASASG